MALFPCLPQTRRAVHYVNLRAVWVQLALYLRLRQLDLHNAIDPANCKSFRSLICLADADTKVKFRQKSLFFDGPNDCSRLLPQ